MFVYRYEQFKIFKFKVLNSTRRVHAVTNWLVDLALNSLLIRPENGEENRCLFSFIILFVRS